MMKVILLGAAALTLSACATTQPALHSQSPEFGHAVRHNIAAHSVTPTAEQKADTYIPADAAKRTIARENYRKGETPEPQRITTTN